MNLSDLARLHKEQSAPDTAYNTPVPPFAVQRTGTGQRPVRTRRRQTDLTVEDMLYQIMLDMRRLARQNFDAANPVDEWMSSSQVIPSPVTIMRDYDLPERIESIAAWLPVGITAATLQLGQRFIPLYSGVATTLITFVNPTGLGIIVGPDDKRELTYVGAATSGLAIGLMGHTLEREGDR